MQVSVLNDRYDSGKYGSPRYFDVAWSETGDMNADGDWAYIASYTVPDMRAGPRDALLAVCGLETRRREASARNARQKERLHPPAGGPGTSAEASTNTPRSR